MTENIFVFEHSSIGIKDERGMIYVDPFSMKNSPNDAAFIFVTHEHFDHYSPEDIAKVVGKDTVLIIPESMKDKVQEVSSKMSSIVTINPGESLEISGLKFEAVPAYNTDKAFHPKDEEWVGYVITSGCKRIYIAGDTDDTEEAGSVKCDIALIPVGGTYTMDVDEAAEFINRLRPEFAIPTHYGTVVGEKSDGEAFAGKVKEPVKVEIKLQF